MSTDRQLIITGASSDLGSVLANALAEDGVRIIGTMRRERRIDDTFPQNVQIVDKCDLTNPEDCARLARIVDDAFDSPFGFIHSVGEFWEHVPFSAVPAAQARQMFASHVDTLYNVLQLLTPLMQARQGGNCVAFSCTSVRYNYPWMAAFTASKSAVDSLMRSLANEFAGDGMRFNSLILASLKTQKVRRSKPFGDFARFLTPTDIVPVVRFLLSPESRLVNGNNITLFEHSDKFYSTGYFQRVKK